MNNNTSAKQLAALIAQISHFIAVTYAQSIAYITCVCTARCCACSTEALTFETPDKIDTANISERIRKVQTRCGIKCL